jgi:glutathione S-transferase
MTMGLRIGAVTRLASRGFATRAELAPIRMFDLAAGDPAVLFSPSCWRITMAAAHKGIPLERIPWRMTEKSLLPKPNMGTVPVIVDANNNGHVEYDSLRIASYLERQYPHLPSLFGNKPAPAGTFEPNDASERSAQFVAAWAERVLVPQLGMMLVSDVYQRVGEAEQNYFRTTRERWYKGKTLEEVQADRDTRVIGFRQLLSPARAMIKGDLLDRKPQLWLGSPSGPTFSDYILFGLFQWARCISVSFTSLFLSNLFTDDISPLQPGFAQTMLEDGDPLKAWFERMLDLHGGLGRNAHVWKE